MSRNHRWIGKTVDAAAARAHLLKLKDLGLGIYHIANLASLSHVVIARVRNGRLERISDETERRILTVKLTLAKGQRVNKKETAHLIRALREEGYSQAELARRLGLDWHTIHGKKGRGKVRVSTALKVRAMWKSINEGGQA